MRTKVLRIDFEKASLVMDKSFAKAAAIVGSEEYLLLQGARQDYPTFTVSVKTIKRNPNKESYNGLTYAYMERYITAHDDENQTIMKEYRKKREIAECHSIRFPHIKQWFLTTYPEIKEFSKVREETVGDENQEKRLLAAINPSVGVAA